MLYRSKIQNNFAASEENNKGEKNIFAASDEAFPPAGVMPAYAGIHLMDSRFRGNDDASVGVFDSIEKKTHWF